MKNKSLILYTVILVLMSITLISKSVSADTFNLTGTMASGGENIHSFTLSYDGELVLDITVASTLDLSFRFNTCVLIYDSDGTTWLWSGNGPCGTCGTTNMTLAPIILKAGSYYLEVSGSKGEGSYTIAATHTPPPFSNDTEPNDEVSQAQTTTLADGMTGHLGYKGGGTGRTADAADWWSFSIPSDGELTLDIEVDTTLDFSFQSHTCLLIYDSDGKTSLWSGNGPCGSCGTTDMTLAPLNLKAGNYYLEVTESGGSYGSYSIATTHTPSAFPNDTEPNDEVSQAQATTLSAGMTGHLGYVGGGSGRAEDEIDWWSFSVPSDGELTLDIEVASTLDLSFQSHTCLVIYDSDGTSWLWSGNGPCGSCGTTSMTLDPINLKAGSYYLEVTERVGSYGGYAIATTFSDDTATSTTTIAVDSSTTTIDGETSTTTTAESDTTTTIDNGSTTTTSVCPSESIYGEHAEETELLRVLRDNVLSHTPEGQEIIRLYYQWSPVIVKAMEGDAEFQEEVKEMVDEVLELITETK